MELKILENFFDEHHRRLKEKAHTLYQCTCGTFSVHSEYSEWLKLKNRQNLPFQRRIEPSDKSACN